MAGIYSACMTNYIELHCHSNFSLLDGASPPDALVMRAVELGMSALALTDHDAVYGVVTFIKAAQKYGVQPIFGAEMTLEDGHHLTLLVQNATGWRNLCELITLARHNAPKGEALLLTDAIEGRTEGLIALSGCRKGKIAAALVQGNRSKAVEAVDNYINWFGRDRFYIELHHHGLPTDARLVHNLMALAHEHQLPYVATNNVHYATRASHQLQDVLVAIRHNTTLAEAQLRDLCRPNSEYYLKSAEEMGAVFRRYPNAVTNTVQIAEQCQFQLEFGLQTLPTFPTPTGLSAYDFLQSLCEIGLSERRIERTDRVMRQLHHELEVIERSGLSNYFLIVWDIVRYARENNILCQGRGSAANSLVAYLLSISPVNPLEHHLVFERFLSDERSAVPDIDIDFAADRREEVIQYIYGRYGHQGASMACTFVTFRTRSAIRDVGKALGLPVELLDRIADVGLDDAAELDQATWARLIDLCGQIKGFPRHLGIHNGGMVVMGVPIAQRVPTEPATMADRYVVQWDKDALEDARLVKIDILGLRMLSAIAEGVEIVHQTKGVKLDLHNLRFDDPNIYAMISEADTIGVFQVESRAQAQVLPRLQPRTFNDLIVSISLIRPGPIQGNMVHPYLRRRLGQEPITYPHPLLQGALEETHGVVLFQEQVLKVARDLAGLKGGEGEQLRRALGAKHAGEALERFENTFLKGAVAKGVEQVIASAVFDTLRAFGGYSFPKSHAAAFAVLVYQSAFLRRYYPQAFYTALLNNQPMGFWSPAVLVNDAKRHGVAVLGVDVNRSSGKCTVEGDAIRLGYRYVKGFGDTAIQKVMEARESGAFKNLLDFCKRTQLPQRLIEHLILVGGMDSWQQTRRKLIWKLGTLDYRPDTFPLVVEDDDLQFPAVSLLEVIGIEYGMLGLSLREHPLTFYRPQLAQRGFLSSHDLEGVASETRVKVAGMLLVHQAPPTAKGHHFLTLDDEHGFMNVILRPKIYAACKQIIRDSLLLIVEGVMQRQGNVINLLADKLYPLR
jgi:error-prone DNA polymerase